MHVCSVVSLLTRYFNVNVVHGGIVVQVSDKMFAALVEFNSLHWYCGDCEPSVSDRLL